MNRAENPSGGALSWIVAAPGEVSSRCEDGRSLRAIAATSIASVIVGGAAFGFLLGTIRSPLQGLYSGLKLPMAWLLTLAVCAPAYYAVSSAMGAPMRFRAVCATVLAATARAAIVLIAFVPVFWLAINLLGEGPLAYHRAIALAAILYGLAGLAALRVLVPAFEGRAILLVVVVGLFLGVGGQAAWALRPFVGRPADVDAEVPFLRPAEDTFVEALPRALESSTGSYRRAAPHRTRSIETSSTEVR